MRALRLSLAAAADLEGIVDYLVMEAGRANAHSLLSDLVSAFDLLATSPWIGHVRPDLIENEVRFWIVHRYLIAYVASSEVVDIVRVLHGSRDPGNLGEDIRRGRV